VSPWLEASSDAAMAWGAGVIYTHVHAENLAARRLYHRYGFRAPAGVGSTTHWEPATSSTSDQGLTFGDISAQLELFRPPYNPA
jgi:hypothetical protein